MGLWEGHDTYVVSLGGKELTFFYPYETAKRSWQKPYMADVIGWERVKVQDWSTDHSIQVAHAHVVQLISVNR